MSIYRRQLSEVIRGVSIVSPVEYTWFGARRWQVPKDLLPLLSPAEKREYLHYSLHNQLYLEFYCTGGIEPRMARRAVQPGGGPTSLAERLADVNYGHGQWQEGWRAMSVKAGEDGEPELLVVSNREIKLWVRPSECNAADTPARPGSPVSVLLPKDLPAISPAFYMAIGDKPLKSAPPGQMLRLYWNVTVEGGVALMRQVTRSLNEAGIPFRLKVLDEPSRYSRCDAGVLYLRTADFEAVRPLLQEIYRQLRPEVGQSVPALTLRLAPGLGLAEDPGYGESFGMHRCSHVAAALLAAYDVGVSDDDARLEIVTSYLAENGIDIDRPYLSPGSTRKYAFEFEQRTWLSPDPGDYKSPSMTYPVASPQRPTEYLEVAHRIAERIAREAVWYEGLCNWIGASQTGSDGGRSAQQGLVYRALGPDLYAGTAGLALFLAYLSEATGDVGVRRTALGAIRQALSQVAAIKPAMSLGLYTGWPGVALAAQRVGSLLSEEGVLSQGRDLALTASLDASAAEFDLLSGSAGAILALTLLASELKEGQLLCKAEELGRTLLAEADKAGAGYSWRSRAHPETRNLTGLSHGASGIAYAFLELYRATGNELYRQACEMALQYERHWFDPGEGNWPDFRFSHARRKRANLPFSTAWCHGAPGIALTRLHAYDTLGGAVLAEEATTALSTTRKSLYSRLEWGISDFSLCHGVAGLAEVLDHARGLAWASEAADEQLILDVAARGIEHYAIGDSAWPCGVAGDTPSLMLGRGGIGLFYLRLFSPAIPSVLFWNANHNPPPVPSASTAATESASTRPC